MLLSVIIPVYNGEKYLDECIKSIINQDISSYEIIAIDDGSTDDSLELLLNYKKNIKNFRVFSQKNKGAASARNVGLQNAKGKMVMFMDADDWLESKSLKKIMSNLENTTEMLIFSFRRVGQKEKTEWIQPKKAYISGKEYLGDVLNKSIQGPGSQCWHIYRKSFLEKYNICFNEKYRRMQDYLFNLDCMEHAIYVKAVDTIGYNWRIENSASLTYNFSENFPDAVALFGKKLRGLLKLYGWEKDEDMKNNYYDFEMSAFKMIFKQAKNVKAGRKEKWALYKECLAKDISNSTIKCTQRGCKAVILLKAKKYNNVILLLLWELMDINYWIGCFKYFMAVKVIPRNTLRRRIFNKVFYKG